MVSINIILEFDILLKIIVLLKQISTWKWIVVNSYRWNVGRILMKFKKILIFQKIENKLNMKYVQLKFHKNIYYQWVILIFMSRYTIDWIN